MQTMLESRRQERFPPLPPACQPARGTSRVTTNDSKRPSRQVLAGATHSRRHDEWVAAMLRALTSGATRAACVEWPLDFNSGGYGYVRFGGRLVVAHRVMWGLDRGPIPPGLFVCHSCD